MKEDRQIESDGKSEKAMGSNPSKAASQLLSDYLEVGSNYVFEPLKKGVFEPDFNPIEFERFVTILYPDTRVRCETHPDIEILSPVMETKRECVPVSVFENGELCKYGVSS